MLMLKLKRTGKKHQASYRLIVDEKRHRMYGKNVEDLGWYDPKTKKAEFNKEQILHWIKNGAQPSDTVHNLLVTLKITSGKKIAVHKKPKKEEVKATVPGASPAAAAAKPAEAAAAPAVEAPKA